MFNTRLKEERERIELNQEDFAEACGIKRNAQIKYESGDRSPKSDYLERASKLGVDVGYIITGVRTSPVDLPSDEAFLLDSYRSLNAPQKKIALQFLLGGIENIKEDVDVAATTDNSSQQGVFDSPNTTVKNSFNNQSGFTELPFIQGCAVFGCIAFICSFVAMFEVIPNPTANLWLACGAIILFFVTMLLAIFGNEAGRLNSKNKIDNTRLN